MSNFSQSREQMHFEATDITGDIKNSEYTLCDAGTIT
jgi:hypothetical protein